MANSHFTRWTQRKQFLLTERMLSDIQNGIKYINNQCDSFNHNGCKIIQNTILLIHLDIHLKLGDP